MPNTPVINPAAAAAGVWDDNVDTAAEQTDIRVSVRLDQELQTVRLIEPRADAKAAALLSLACALLVAALAVFGSGKLPAAAATAAAVGAGLLGITVLLLTAALRPQLGGDFGFPRWARAATSGEILDLLACGPALDSPAAQLEQAQRLRLLSVALHAKFTRMRTAQTLTGLALAAGVVAAALSAIGR